MPDTAAKTPKKQLHISRHSRIVYTFHATWARNGIVEHALTSITFARIIQLPIVRALHGGHAMVAVFFLIGGYVNAAKPLQLIRNQRYAELAEN